MFIPNQCVQIVPYVMNLYSSINITRKIANDDNISSYSKQYFRGKSKIFTLLVLLSGGSFRALKFMNCNLFGLAILSSGLSNLQPQRLQSHHHVATAFA